MPPLTNDAFEPITPLTVDVVEPVPPLDGEVFEDDGIDPPQAFGGGPLELPPLPLYSNNIARHICDGKDRNTPKFINHGRKIIGLPHPNEEWFPAALSIPGMKDLCMNG
ncbi:unnamed protein product [Lathyrus oleraceus]